MKNCLDKVTVILSGLGAAIAIPASAATAGAAVTSAAIGLPLIASLSTGALLYSAIKERKKDDCKALLASAKKRVMDTWPYEDPTSRTEQAQRDRLEKSLAEVLPKCLPEDEQALRVLLAVEGLNGAKIAETLLTDAPIHNSIFYEPGARAFFHDVVASAWDALRSEPDFYATLQSHVDEAMFVRLHDIKVTMIERFDTLQTSVDDLVAAKGNLSREFGIKEGMLIALARKYAEGNLGDFDAALVGLEHALEVARDQQKRGRLPSNIDGAVDTVITRIDTLNDSGELDAAQAALDAELASLDEEDERRRATRSRLYEKGIAQAILTRSVENACRLVTAQFDLVAPSDPDERYRSFRAVYIEWYQRGSDKGLNFDLEVAIALAQKAVDRAETIDQRGAMQTNLGNALQTLGSRESGAERLKEAVTAFKTSLEERTRECVPLDWAATQMNLGNALQTLGERESGTERLEEAVMAYESALEEWTRKRVPLDWAATQMNLGNALYILGERESGTERLEEAVMAYESALEEWTRKRVPLQWAMTQANLGNALQTLGERESDTERLEKAVTAYESALEERTRERVPLQWAMTQANLGNALQTAYFA